MISSLQNCLSEIFFGNCYSNADGASLFSNRIKINWRSTFDGFNIVIIIESDGQYNIELGDEELRTLAEIFNIETSKIYIAEWEETNPGCETYDDGSWGNLQITIPSKLPLSEIESKIPNALEKLKNQREADQKEAEEYHKKLKLEREIKKEKNRQVNLQRELKSKERKFAEASALRIFEIFKDQIFSALIEDFNLNNYAKLDRKTLAKILNTSPIQKFFFMLHKNEVIEIKTNSDKIKLGNWWKERVNLKVKYE